MHDRRGRSAGLVVVALLGLLGLASSAEAGERRALGIVRPAGSAHASARSLWSYTPFLMLHGGERLSGVSYTHAIYWDPARKWKAPYGGLVDRFLGDVYAARNDPETAYAVAWPYLGSRQPDITPVFGGSFADTAAYPAGGCTATSGRTCVWDSAIASEVDRVGSTLGWGGPSVLFLMLPPGVDVCIGGTPGGGCSQRDFCGYHSWTSNRRIYAVIPYPDPGGCRTWTATNGKSISPNGSVAADAAIDTISHEHIEALTDPYGDGYYDDVTGWEIADVCVDVHGPTLGRTGATPDTAYNQVLAKGHYWLQAEWGNEAQQCLNHRQRPPAAPTNIAVAGEGGGLFVTFTPPDVPVIRTSVHLVVTSLTGTVDVYADGSSAAIGGLTDGDYYEIAARSENAVGSSPWVKVAATLVGGVPAPVPAVPAVTPLAGALQVDFVASPDDGGSPITGYRVTLDPGGRQQTVAGTTAVFDGLANGTAYTASVVALNALGASRSVAALPAVALGPPPVPVGSVRGGGKGLLLTFGPGGTLAPDTYLFDITVMPGNIHVSYPADPNGSPYWVPDLLPGTSYAVTIVELGSAGSSPPLEIAPILVYDVPAAPTSADLTRSPNGFRLHVPGPLPGVLSYTVLASPGDVTWSFPVAGPDPVLTGLQNGVTYTIAIEAVNEAGSSPPYTAGTVTPAGPPDAPLSGTAVAGVRSVTVNAVPGADQAAPITGYLVAVGSRPPVLVSSLPAVIPGLPDGSTLEVSIAARNAMGDSVWLSLGSVTTVPRPGVVPAMRATVSGHHVTVRFRRSANAFAARVVSYRVLATRGKRRVIVKGAGTSLRLTLTPGIWTVRVIAVGAAGDGAATAPVRVKVR
jgi:hypothetical protein